MRYGLKERLLGAGILIALAVIFIPFLFEEPMAAPEIAVEIPLPPKPAPIEINIEKPVPPKLEEPTPEQEAARIKHNQETISGLELEAAGGAKAWAIQVASFTESKNAKSLVNRLKQQDFPAYWRKINSMAVVFVGPYLSEASARNEQQVLLQQQNLKTLVTGYVPEYLAKERGSLPTADD